MSDDWDFYFCRVDDRPASIFVDLGVAATAPIKSLPVIGYIRVRMRAPREDGLSSQDEFETLTTLERALEKLQLDGAVAYVGRDTSDRYRDFYLYLDASKHWHQRVADAMHDFPEYVFESGTRNDPGWATYFDFLHPSEDRERIQNRRTCDVLEKRGDHLGRERPIDHWAYFPDRHSRDAFTTEAKMLGYTIEEMIESEGEHRYGVRLSSLGRPSLHEIDDLTLHLFRAARAHGGAYDGWETQVVR
jgi:Family of unknown function (DUF695)/Regulator of ribonuclease activity B